MDEILPPTDPVNCVPEIKVKKKRPPLVIEAFSHLSKNPQFPYQEYRVRIVKYKSLSSNSLDLREYCYGPLYETYTQKGITLNLQQVDELYKQLPKIMDRLKQLEEGKHET